jgi:hypothetical protein
MTSLKQQLRGLMAEYGMRSVNNTLKEILSEDYQYLCEIFEKKQVPQPTVNTEGQTGEVAPPPAQPITESAMKKLRVRVSKGKAEEPAPAPAPAPASSTEDANPQQEIAPIPLNILLTNVSPSPPSTVSSPRSQPPQRTAQEIKKFQKLAEETKRRELKEKGVTVEQVLTKENLQKWIVEEKHTFAWVAREKAGCPETQVSSVAKSMGIQSPISARRGLLVSKKAP